MLEDTRKRGATILIYLVFGLLIVVFAISFGPQSFGGGQGCKNPQAAAMLTLDGKNYGMNSWRWAMNTRRAGPLEQRTKVALDVLIRRELLAQEAERRGLIISDDVVDRKITAGELWILGEKIDGKTIYFDDGEFFNYEAMLNTVVRQFGLSIGSFKAEQRRELLAVAMEQILGSGARVARDEVFAEWLHAERTVTFKAVVFEAKAYAKAMILTDADIARYLSLHEDAVKARYEADKPAQYTATVPRVKVRRVFVKKTDKAEEQQAQKASLEAARAEIVGKKKTFAQVAGALDSDEGLRAKGGELGWKLPDAPDLGDPALTTALTGLTPGGEPSPVVETATGFWLLAVEEKREGDLSFDQVKLEIAAALARDAWSQEAARRAADEALAGLTAGKKRLEDVFKKMPDVPGANPDQQQQLIEFLEQQLQDPNLDPSMRQQFEDALERARAGQLGVNGTWESEDIPAEWAQGDAAEPAVPAAPPAPAPAKVDHSKDPLPKFKEIEQPAVHTIGPMPRDKEQVGGIGRSEELIRALFEEMTPGSLATKVYPVESTSTDVQGFQIGEGSSYVIAELVERPDPDVAEFEKNADALMASEERQRAAEIVSSWLQTRCQDLVAKKEISIHRDLLVTQDEGGEKRTFEYPACSNL